MGFRYNHQIGEGVRILGDGVDVSLIVRDIGGYQDTKKVIIEVDNDGSKEIVSLHTREILDITDEILIGLSSKRSEDMARIMYYVDKTFLIEEEKYSRGS